MFTTVRLFSHPPPPQYLTLFGRTLSSLHAPSRPSQNPISQVPCSLSQTIPLGLLPTPTSMISGSLDLMPKISSHPALMGTQIRCGPRDTYSPSHFKRKRRVGFLARIRTRSGRNVLKARRLKGRKSLSH